MTRTSAPTQVRGASAVLHGMHPLRGYPVTWHLTPLVARPQHPAEFLVERADGHIEDATAWQLAEKEVAVMDSREMCDLVRRASAISLH
ncbi:hypothetical protein [Cellulomonas sp. KRMCY2]|uniref:hypothetical protein n=1 Tax=Cellulomonas sp. KRMCY2 TaxID=1304865 RepID=UPI00045E7E01|nr:hypothetical protein [Cellulomonas sp. KRMCY2]